jgi:PAS domain S-box-containing protein
MTHDSPSLPDNVLAALGEAVILVDARGLIMQINAAAERLYEVRLEQIVGRTLLELIGEMPVGLVTEGLAAIRRGEIWKGTVWHQKPGGQRFRAEVTVRQLDARGGLIAVVRDVTEREADHLRQLVLKQTFQIIADTDSLPDTHAAILESLTTVGGADAAIFRAREPQGYRALAVAGVTLESLEAEIVTAFEDEEPALLRGQIVSADHTQRHWLTSYALAEKLGFTRIQLIGQRVGGRLVGTLALLYRQSPVLDLTPILPELAAALAAQLERVRQFEMLTKRNRLLELLNRIDRLSLEYLSFQRLLETLTEGLQEIFNVVWVSVGHVSPRETSITWLARTGPEPTVVPEIKPLVGVAAQAVRSRQITHFGGQIRTGMYIPVANSEGTLLLSLVDHHGAFSEEEQRDARFIAAQLALALSRSQDRERLVRERQSLEVLAQVSAAMRQATTQAELYTIAAEYALRATGASTTIVLLANEARDAMSFAAIAGVNAEAMRQLPVTRKRGLSWQVLDTGKPRIEDIAASLPEAHTVRPLAQGAYIGIPIFQGEGDDRRTIGVLNADTQADGHRFTPTDLDCLTAVAEALSSARARLEALETARARADAFALLAQLSSDLENLDDESDIASRGLEALLRLTGLEGAAYFAFDGERLSVVTTAGRIPDVYVELQEGTVVQSGKGGFGHALQSLRAHVIDDYQQHPRALEQFRHFGFRTVLNAPVILGGHVRAFLAAASFAAPSLLTQQELEIVEFLTKRLSRALERAEQIGEILSTRASSFRALGRALEIRDFETKGHTDRVVEHSLRLGRRVGLNDSQLQHLEWGALLHDIGKIAIPDTILLKPGKLTPEEWRVIRDHPEIGYGMLEDLHFLPTETLEIVLYHQERLNGSGYPEARRGDHIPFLARLFAVVDVYDALISVRAYKGAWTLEDAASELRRQAGVTLDAELVRVFLEEIE